MNTLCRRAIGLWVLGFLLLGWSAEATGLHACPHHAGIGAPGAVAAAPAEHGHHGAAPAGHSAQREHAGCTCSSGCPTAGGVAPLPLPVERGLVAFTDFVRPVAATRGAVPAHPEPYFLPYGLAPPSLS